jgi:hypothetical protein
MIHNYYFYMIVFEKFIFLLLKRQTYSVFFAEKSWFIKNELEIILSNFGSNVHN